MTPGGALVAFDLDGTLLDSAADICFHVNRALEELGLAPRPDADILPHVGHGASHLLKGVLATAPPDTQDRGIAAFRASYSARPLVHATLFPGADACLRALEERGVALAVVSNKLPEITASIVAQLGLAGRLVHVDGPGNGRAAKPDPAMLREAARKAGAAPAATVMVGDSVVDLDTSLGFGARFVGVAHGLDGGAGLRARGVTLVPDLVSAAHAALGLLGREA